MTTVVAEVVEVDFCLLYMPIEAGLESIDIETDFLGIYHNLEPREFYRKFVKSYHKMSDHPISKKLVIHRNSKSFILTMLMQSF